MASQKATQEFVSIEEVKDGILILKDGTMRAILLASSINFALKSADEQQAIIMQFQDFLNSLDFSAQIFIQSRRLDIRPYIAMLEERQKAQVVDLMKIQTREYIEFIKSFIESTNIMTKNFFIVIPYSPVSIEEAMGFFGKFFKKPPSVEEKKRKAQNFEENRSQLEQRIGIVQQGLIRCGVRVAQLGTEEVVELFYKLFNPGETEKPIKLA